MGRAWKSKQILPEFRIYRDVSASRIRSIYFWALDIDQVLHVPLGAG